MTSVPQESVVAAAAAIRRELHPGEVYTMTAGYDERIARAALEAAAPALAEHAAAAILAHMERSTRYRRSRNRRGLRAYRRHFGTAARVAAGAFVSDEDLKREAAKALERIYRRRMAENEGTPGA